MQLILIPGWSKVAREDGLYESFVNVYYVDSHGIRDHQLVYFMFYRNVIYR